MNKITTTTATVIDKQVTDSGQVVLFWCHVDTRFLFAEGQFVMLSAMIDGKLIKRAYSIASTCRELHEHGRIGFCIKRVDGGVFSSYCLDVLQVGDQIGMVGPLGHFVDKHLSRNYLLISVGSGLSPVYSLYRHLVHESGEYDRLVNLFGEKTRADVPSSVATEFVTQTDHVHSSIYLSREQREGCRHGRIQAGLDEAIQRLGTHQIACFVCGKPEMVDDVVQKLLGAGVPKEFVVYEKY